MNVIGLVPGDYIYHFMVDPNTLTYIRTTYIYTGVSRNLGLTLYNTRTKRFCVRTRKGLSKEVTSTKSNGKLYIWRRDRDIIEVFNTVRQYSTDKASKAVDECLEELIKANSALDFVKYFEQQVKLDESITEPWYDDEEASFHGSFSGR